MAEHVLTTPPPAPENPPTRRLILSAFTGAAFAGMAVTIAPEADALSNPDAELIAACKRFAYLEEETGRLLSLTDLPLEHDLTAEEEKWQEELDSASTEQHEIGAWLTDHRPQTAAGQQAKAQAVIAYGGHSTADMISRLTLSLLQDVAAERAP